MYKLFAEEAADKYKQLPYEKEILYKKYMINIKIPDTLDKKTVVGTLWKEQLEKAENSLNLKFDVVIYNGTIVKNQSTSISINQKGTDELDDNFLGNKLFNNSEDKFASYIHAYSKSIIEMGGTGKINILFITSSNSDPIQMYLNATENSNITINEFYISESGKDYTSGFMHEIQSEKNSTIELSMLHLEGDNTDTFSLIKGVTKENSQIKTNLIIAGGRNIRHRNEINASGKFSKIEINDSIIGFNSSEMDIGDKIINSNEKTESESNICAIMFDDSFAYIKGYAKIESGSIKSTSRINERGVLDGKNAFLYLIPDMLINENDVIATHSSASAPIDKDKLFYLQSHGINAHVSKYLMLNGLISKVLSKITDPQMQILLYSILAEKMKNKKFDIPQVKEMQQEVWPTPGIKQ